MVRTGPHEDVAKLYLMDRTRTEEISQQVAAFLRLYNVHMTRNTFLFAFPDFFPHVSCLGMNLVYLIRFSYAELRSFLNMFYEEEEREADRIRTKFLLIKRRLQRQLEHLERKTTEDEDLANTSKEGESLC